MSYEAQKIRLIMDLRRQGISDNDVLSAVERVPREMFVPEAMRAEAYENIPLPISQGQTISQPFIVAYMTQALCLGERNRILEIGTGSGYQAAVLAQLSRRVCTVERYRTLLRQAEACFKALKLHNITTRLGDGGKGLPVGTSGEQVLYRITRQGQELKEERLLDVRFVPLVEGMPPSRA